jgi:predicted signal transduction protein with EAL and GGDEF domain
VGFDLRAIEDSNQTAERIIEAIRQPFVIQGQSIGIGVSIGVSMCPIHATESGELLETADLALYQAKSAGRNTFKSFTNTMISDADQKESVHRGLLEAMSNGALYFGYQPIVNTRTKALHSLEAFARWRHPVKGELSARHFLPLVAQCQLLPQFAEWGIRRVLLQGKQWQRKALPLVPVSVNLSAQQFLSLDLVGLCGSLSRELDVSVEWLRFDLDETALQADFPRAADKIGALSQMGVLINIDHFGQGLVPLNRIIDVKICQLKTSGKHFSAVADVNKSDAMIAIIREVGRVLQVPIVATQIETDLMAARATAAGIEYLQGTLISHELTPDAADGWLRHRMDPMLRG